MRATSILLSVLLALLSIETSAQQKATATGSGTAIVIQGDHNTVRLDAPQVQRLLAELRNYRKIDDFLKNQISRSQAEADVMKRENDELKLKLEKASHATVGGGMEPSERLSSQSIKPRAEQQKEDQASRELELARSEVMRARLEVKRARLEAAVALSDANLARIETKIARVEQLRSQTLAESWRMTYIMEATLASMKRQPPPSPPD